jgi:hypothetical protein
MYVRVVVFAAVISAFIPRIGAAQTVELVYTPAVTQDAIALKESLKGPFVHPSNALTLIGGTVEAKKKYVETLARAGVVLVLGEHALKLVAELGFSAPVILVNATGPIDAKGRVFRVFDKAPPVTAAAVTSSADVTKLMAGAGEVVLRGQIDTTVQAVLGALK